MRLDSLFYRFTYRFGKPPWDTSRHRPELEEIVRGRPPGRALDLGCGTGADARYLARQGWDVVGIDFVPEATERARTGVCSDGTKVRFVTGDVARLRALGVAGPFDLILDVGCYHAIPDRLRDEYAAEVVAVSRPGADFYLAGITHPPASWRLLGASGVDAAELRLRFGNTFDVADERSAGSIGRLRQLNLYHLVRN